MATIRIPKTARDFKPAKTAYFAGLFDGEGCARFAYYSGRKHQYPTLKIAMTDEETVMAIAEYFGCGSVGTRLGPKAHHKRQWWWQVVSNDARKVAGLLLPYAITKRKILQEIVERPHDLRFGKRLSEKAVGEIRRRFRNGWSRERLRKHYSLSRGGIYNILTGRSWGNIL